VAYYRERDVITEEQAKLAAAAPALLRALLAVEWGGWNGEAYDPCGDHCPACGGRGPAAPVQHRHDGTCDLDAALTLAGLADQASRDAARAAIAGRR
jgi:hypothetical protein